MDQLASSIAQAISVLFSHNPSWTTEQKQAANSFILEAITKRESFPALLMVLTDANQHIIVKFFACNLLLDKIRKQWAQISEPERKDVVEKLMYLISSYFLATPNSQPDLQTFRNRAVLLLCAASVRLTEGGLEGLSNLINFILAQQSSASISLSLDILTMVNEELEVIDLPRGAKAQLGTACHILMTTHMNIVEYIFQQASSSSATLLPSCLKYLLSCVKTKLLSLSTLSANYHTIYQHLIESLRPRDLSLFALSCSLWRELIITLRGEGGGGGEGGSTPQPSRPLLDTLCNSLSLATDELLHPYSVMKERGEYLTALTELTETLILQTSSSLDLLITGHYPLYQRVLHHLLFLISHTPRSLFMLCFDLWNEFEDFSDEEKRVFYTPIILKELTQIAMKHILLKCEGDEDWKDLWTFRDLRLGLDDLLSLALQDAPATFFSLLIDLLQQYQTHPTEHFYYLEGALFLCHAGQSRIREQALTSPQVRQLLVELVGEGMRLGEGVGGLNTSEEVREVVRETTCHYLRSVSFLFLPHEKNSPSPASFSLYTSSLSYLLTLSLSPHSSSSSSPDKLPLAAAKAFHKLSLLSSSTSSSSSPSLLLAEEGLLERCIAMLGERYNPSTLPEGACHFLVEGLVRNVVLCPSPLRERLGGLLASPPLRLLEGVLRGGGSSVGREMGQEGMIAHALGYLSQIIRFSDEVPDPSSSYPHYLTEVVGAFWPLLGELGGRFGESAGVMGGVYEVMGRVLTSLRDQAKGQVGAIVQAIYFGVVEGRGYSNKAFTCAIAIIDFLSNLPGEEGIELLFDFLFHLLSHAQRILSHPALLSPSPALLTLQFAYDCDALDELSRLLLLSFASPVVRGRVFSSPNGLLEMSVQILLALLRGCEERDPLRNAHLALHHLFSPPKGTEGQRALLSRLVPSLPLLVPVLVEEILTGRGGSGVVGGIGEALGAVIEGVYSLLPPGQLVGWVEGAMRTSAALPGSVDRERASKVLCVLFVQQSRRAKAFVQDVYKVCVGEREADILLAYEDVLI